MFTVQQNVGIWSVKMESVKITTQLANVKQDGEEQIVTSVWEE